MDELLAAGGLRDRERERVVCIRLLALGRTGSDVAEVIGRSQDTVYRHKARFLREGEQALQTERWGGRRNQVLSGAPRVIWVRHGPFPPSMQQFLSSERG